MAFTPRRSERSLRFRPVVGPALVLAWLTLTGLAAPVEQLQQQIAHLEAQRATLELREQALTARQEELSATIKQLKTDSRSRSGPFTLRKIELALQELRALLVDMETLERQASAIASGLDDARSRLRIAIRNEVHRLLPDGPGAEDSASQSTIRALLDAYPSAPDLPSIPAVRRWPPISLRDEPDVIAERTVLVRDELERQDAVLKHLEHIQLLLQEEQALYESLDDPSIASSPRQRDLRRRIGETTIHIAASRREIRTLEDLIQRLEARLWQAGEAP